MEKSGARHHAVRCESSRWRSPVHVLALNNPDRRPNVFDHSIGIGARKLHAQAVTFSGAYEELVAFVTSFASAIQHGFPEGEALPDAALGKR
jgi:hypothetical protein